MHAFCALGNEHFPQERIGRSKNIPGEMDPKLVADLNGALNAGHHCSLRIRRRQWKFISNPTNLNTPWNGRNLYDKLRRHSYGNKSGSGPRANPAFGASSGKVAARRNARSWGLTLVLLAEAMLLRVRVYHLGFSRLR